MVGYQAAYAALFGFAVVGCLGSLGKTALIEHRETRRGITALLLLSAGWAGTQLIHVVAPWPRLGVASYTVGLVLGLGSVGAWLYFCSAYAGRSYHREPLYRRLSVGVFVAIVGFKLTNPWHGLYFETRFVQQPFAHTAILEQPMFWFIAGLAYVLSGIGFYMLLEAFRDAQTRTAGSAVVVGLAAVPVVFDFIGYIASPPILALNYESVGVGLFAIGALFFVRQPFFDVSRFGRKELVENSDDVILFLDRDRRVQNHNRAAVALFPELAGSDRPMLHEVTDGIDPDLLSDGGAVELVRDGERRYFLARSSPVTAGETRIGTSVVLTEVTSLERQRRELQRKDEQLEGFASAITHELRNSVSIIAGQAELLSQAAGEDEEADVRSRVETIVREASNLEAIVDDLRILAKYGQTISETEYVDIETVARSARRLADVDDLSVRIEQSAAIEADQDRLRELFVNAFRFADHDGASEVRVALTENGFIIRADSRPLDAFEETAVFAHGNAVPDTNGSLLLPNVKMLAVNHGWTIAIPDADELTLEITGAQVRTAE